MNQSPQKIMRQLEFCSLTQGVFLVFLLEWFHYAPLYLQMTGPANAESSLTFVRYFVIALLALILGSFFVLIYIKRKLRRELLSMIPHA